MKMSPEVNEVFAAFVDFQNEVEDVKRDTKSFKGMYATLSQVVQVRKILAKHSLAFTQTVGDCSNGYVELESVILHKSGQYFSETMKIPTGDIPKNAKTGQDSISMAQHIGMNISYARRYGLLAIAGMAQEDNDAELPEASYQDTRRRVTSEYSNNEYFGKPMTAAPIKQEIDVKKLAIDQINSLIKQHNIPDEKITAIKEFYRVSDLKNLSETQAKSVINKIKSTMATNTKEAIC